MEFKKTGKELLGFECPELDITGYENTPITADRILIFEDSVDASVYDCFDPLGAAGNEVFCGYLACKRPDLFSDILTIVNKGASGPLRGTEMDEIQKLFEQEGDKHLAYDFYKFLAEFVNFTVASKKRMNQYFISISVDSSEDVNL